jgi:hypothetical protein
MNLREAVGEFVNLVRLGSDALDRIAANEPVSIDGVAIHLDQIKFHVMRIEEVAEEMAVRIAKESLSKLS